VIGAGVFLHKEKIVAIRRSVPWRLGAWRSCQTVSVSWAWWKPALAVWPSGTSGCQLLC